MSSGKVTKTKTKVGDKKKKLKVKKTSKKNKVKPKGTKPKSKKIVEKELDNYIEEKDGEVVKSDVVGSDSDSDSDSDTKEDESYLVAKINSSKSLINFFKFMSAYTDDSVFLKFSTEGLHMTTKDNSSVWILDCFLDKGHFTKWKVPFKDDDESLIIRILTKDIKPLYSYDGDFIVIRHKIDSSDVSFSIESNDGDGGLSFNAPMMDHNIEMMNIPYDTYTNNVRFSTGRLTKIIKCFSDVDPDYLYIDVDTKDNVSFRTNTNELCFKCPDTVIIEVDCEQKLKEDYHATICPKYLEQFLSKSGTDETSIKFNNTLNFPIYIYADYGSDDEKGRQTINLFLSQKIDDDDIN